MPSNFHPDFSSHIRNFIDRVLAPQLLGLSFRVLTIFALVAVSRFGLLRLALDWMVGLFFLISTWSKGVFQSLNEDTARLSLIFILCFSLQQSWQEEPVSRRPSVLFVALPVTQCTESFRVLYHELANCKRHLRELFRCDDATGYRRWLGTL